jgi:hypothetical protein
MIKNDYICPRMSRAPLHTHSFNHHPAHCRMLALISPAAEAFAGVQP